MRCSGLQNCQRDQADSLSPAPFGVYHLAGHTSTFGVDWSFESRLLLKSASGAGNVEELLKANRFVATKDWSKDGRFLLCENQDPKNEDRPLVPGRRGRGPKACSHVGTLTKRQPTAALLKPQSAVSRLGAKLWGCRVKWEIGAKIKGQIYWPFYECRIGET
jgi:hypothetical protein